MTVPGRGLELQLVLRRLAQRHGVPPPAPVVLPLADPAPHPMVVEGFATTADIDLGRMKFRPYCFGWPLLFRRGFPPLYYKHDETQPVGQIDRLEYDDKGQLKVRATVTHEQARRAGAFSVGARVIEYEIRDADSARFFGLVTAAELSEISLTDRPANMFARVQSRYRVPPQIEFYDTMTARLTRLIALTKSLQEHMA